MLGARRQRGYHVDNLSFDVYQGEIFGLLGPNGAGKTSTIRLIMDIFTPDAGSVQVLGQPPGAAKERVGYLPEERGLYRNLRVLDCLVYLAQLKGVPTHIAHQQAMALLERVGLADRAHSKVKELSRGMQQKAQFVASLVHDPELVILDEPFQGLDPVNVELVKTLIAELRDRGKTVVLSTHQMNQVEALCNRILLINHGRPVLYGPLDEIKAQYGHNRVRLRTPVLLQTLPGVTHVERHDRSYELHLAEETTPQALLKSLVEQGVIIEQFEIASVPLEQIFIAVVGEDEHE
ncbi:MAG TPA: ATP-binding cassette domain-containing protein [Anaerolineae bacterium]|nr:ATP-binding cassette domain-containing protein [Anaerolineae bacterium]